MNGLIISMTVRSFILLIFYFLLASRCVRHIHPNYIIDFFYHTLLYAIRLIGFQRCTSAISQERINSKGIFTFTSF